MKVAIIGGIGSGKSTVLKVVKDLGFYVLSADEINNDLLSKREYVQEIAKTFPTAVIDGKVDRATLSKIVFADDERRRALNAIAHPQIVKRILECDLSPLAVELPLAIESGILQTFDRVILVTAPLGIRIDRLKGRGVDENKARRIIAVQATDEDLSAYATDVIDNGGDVDALVESVKKLLR